MSDASFGQFGSHFQEILLQQLLVNAQWAAQIEEVIDTNYFDLKYLQFLSERFFEYSRKYKTFPTLKLLVSIVKDELKEKRASDEVLCSQVVDYLQRMRLAPDQQDAPYVRDKALDFCRRQAMRKALENAIDSMEGERYEEIVADVRRATMVGTVASVGHDFMNDIEARFSAEARRCVATGIPELDTKEMLDGGVACGELATVVACTAVGKSHWLVHMGASALKQGKSVVHYTMELSELKVGTRYDSHFTEIDATYIFDRKDDVLKKYEELELGKLFIKYYPTMAVTVSQIRAHLERLSFSGFVPDLIIIDYADLVRSQRQYESPRFEIKAVYEELRGLAGELNVPIWTASQSNKDGQDKDILDVGNMGEAYSKGQISDLVVTLSRKAQERALGVGRLYVAKNRAGRDGIVYPVYIDTAQSRFTIKGEATTPDAARVEDEQSMKSSLSRKWAELQREGFKIS